MEPRAYIHLRLLILAVAAGCVDAASFLDFDQVFTANQTGNTVLLGIALGSGDGAAIVRTGSSIAGFVVGVMLGALVLRNRPKGWDGHVDAILLAQALVLGVAAAIAHPLGTTGLTTVVAATMGAQSAAAQHVGVPGISTTFVSGTLTRFATQLVRLGRKEGPGLEAPPPLIWCACLGGAVVGGVLSRFTSGDVAIAAGAAIVALSALPGLAAKQRSRRTR
jgi:uncharacterized membrane protein YoaK (UPF0700 family)